MCVVGIATGHGLDDLVVGVRVPVGSKIFSFPRTPDRLWSPLSLLSNEYRGLFPRGWSDRCVKLTTHFQLVPRSRKYGSIHSFLHTPSWRSACLVEQRDNFTVPFTSLLKTVGIRVPALNIRIFTMLNFSSSHCSSARYVSAVNAVYNSTDIPRNSCSIANKRI
jgi:hypothetical protein